MERKILITIILCLSISGNAQKGKMGINTINPTETLDVNGKTYTNTLHLRNPGEPTMTGGRFLATSQNSLQIQDSTTESSGLFNYLQLILTGVSASGITDYDTKIDVNNFLVVVHNYAFKLNDGKTSVALDYGGNQTNDNRQGSPEVFAFKQNNTWHIKATFTNSKFVAIDPLRPTYNNYTVELYLMAYKRLITKQNIGDVNADLGGTNGSTQTINKPSGF